MRLSPLFSPLFPPLLSTLLSTLLSLLLSLLLQPASATAVAQTDNTNPFAPPICRDGYLSCNTVDHPEVCCPVNTVCTFDSLGTIACCPYQSACTGYVIPQNLTKYQIPAPASDRSGAGRGRGGGWWLWGVVGLAVGVGWGGVL
ncbi:uncharacterized protein H6S33_007286 [Morchella sextelata]|uniref:uncharacterized protein n=1 Tax=Morchella sextelata TaxID=1174677 RepID=UPI001D036331|nr:uncharacterized protein H6S33_007286 [Morchella sextelata]KAH0603627.1 hypothetical protein H6S33_007286 [Morchella sextelata]